MQVFVTGRVNKPGRVVVPQGSTLNQAISLAGGTKVLKGKVEFVRFTRQGTIDRRIFSHRPNSSIDSSKNPILADGDIIYLRPSIFNKSLEVVNER